MLTRTFSWTPWTEEYEKLFFKYYEKKEKGRDAVTHTHIYPIIFVAMIL